MQFKTWPWLREIERLIAIINYKEGFHLILKKFVSLIFCTIHGNLEHIIIQLKSIENSNKELLEVSIKLFEMKDKFLENVGFESMWYSLPGTKKR